jgi:archaellum biogenesis protein FlaJ (TadC family)
MTPEIRAFEFAIGVFAVLIGLAIADIATSFQRLLGSRSTVKWDPLALLAATYALCMAIYMWFDLWGVRNFAATRNFLFYLALFAELFVLYLIAASSLPSDGFEHDLREFYSRNRRRFWFLIVLFQIGYVAAGCYFIADSIAKLPGVEAALVIVQMFSPLILALILYFTKSRVVHYFGLGLLFVVMLIHYGRASIN